MQINLDKTQLTEYKSQTAKNIKTTGFAQKGYHSILRYDSWKEQKCMVSATRLAAEDVKDVALNACEWIDVIELKEYVDLIVSKGATHIFITGSTNDEDELTNINIDAIKRFYVNRDESEYYSVYENYVALLNLDNINTWSNYKHDLEQDEKAEYKELHQFLDAKKVYEKLKHKFE